MGSAILRAAHARQMDFPRIEYESETGECEVPHSAQVIRRKGNLGEDQFYLFPYPHLHGDCLGTFVDSC